MNTHEVILGIENVIMASLDKEVREVGYELIDRIKKEGINDPWD